MKISETFARYTKMTARVAVYVPGTSGPDTADADLAARMTEQTAAALSELFGGATITDASGAWVSDTCGLVREAVKIVYSFAMPEQLDEHADEILRIVEQVKREMRQEMVSVEINGALYLV